MSKLRVLRQVAKTLIINVCICGHTVCMHVRVVFATRTYRSIPMQAYPGMCLHTHTGDGFT